MLPYANCGQTHVQLQHSARENRWLTLLAQLHQQFCRPLLVRLSQHLRIAEQGFIHDFVVWIDGIEEANGERRRRS